MPSCVIVVENLPVPLDRRVWQEALALRAAGWKVSVICPLNDQHPETYEVIDDIAIYRHPLPLEASGKLGFVVEYVAALFHEARLLLKVARERGFDVIQACNPPDLIFLVAAPFKLFGKRFVFDHHDVAPELFEAKYGKRGFFHTALLMAERLTFQTADLVISANDTYRDIAMTRGGKAPDDVVTVYSVPDRLKMMRVEPSVALRAGARIVLGYVGIIGMQDGVDHMVRCVHHLISDHGLNDFRAVIVGDGPALASVRALADELGVSDRIQFTGYLRGKALMEAISTFDIGIIPDPINPYNDKISMNKVFEYSSLGVPSVTYALTETCRLLEDAGTYADDGTPAGLARACLPLMQGDELRKAKAEAAQALADRRFSWDREAAKYVGAFDRLR
jgi:glycosyltransferase involved in cell wall biosynthesis